MAISAEMTEIMKAHTEEFGGAHIDSRAVAEQLLGDILGAEPITIREMVDGFPPDDYAPLSPAGLQEGAPMPGQTVGIYSKGQITTALERELREQPSFEFGQVADDVTRPDTAEPVIEADYGKTYDQIRPS